MKTKTSAVILLSGGPFALQWGRGVIKFRKLSIKEL